jgi:hypothetical protein
MYYIDCNSSLSCIYILLVCHDPLTHDEINFIIEHAQKQQRSKVIDWKFIIRDLEKKFDKLHSIKKIRDFWHSWNLDLSCKYHVYTYYMILRIKN